MKLVCYFSASGVTKKVAEKVCNVANGKLFEIEPLVKYTEEDLDWTNNESRSSVEMKNRIKPGVKNKITDLESYDTIIIGFPIWWYTYPTIIGTFLDENNLEGKKIYVFITSGSSGVDKTFNDLKQAYPNLNFIDARRFNSNVSEDEILDLIS